MPRKATKPKATLAPGARVLVRDEEWLVLGASPAMNNTTAVRCVGLSELVRGHERVILTNLDEVTELRPEETELVTDDSPGFRRSRLYLEAMLRRTPPTDSALHLGHRAAMEVKEFQLQPAHMALNALRPRILLADGVGLGKTIEVGILLSELIKRGRGERILVVAIKSMLSQFQQELWARFAIGLVRLDSIGLQRVRAQIPANKNPFYHFNRVIISIDTLKNDGQYRHYLEQCRWDAIVIDECHNVANADTQRNRLASLLARTSESLILTSATPHNGRPESFANLINMIDPTAVASPAKYTAEEIKGRYVRRFKKDVASEVQNVFQNRQNLPLHVQAGPEEDEVHVTLKHLSFSTFRARRRSGRDALFQTTLLKAFLSSPAACLQTVDNRVKVLDRALEKEKGDPAALRRDQTKLESLRESVARVGPEQFSKYQELLKILKKFKWTGKPKSPRILVFSERRATLEWLAEQLGAKFKLKPDVLGVFHAGLPDVEQQQIVSDFGKKDAKVRILLASDVASEGVNLHFYCHNIIHFDVPWSLITLEQRNGRIDRFGQEHIPVIRYLLTVSQEPKVKADLRIIEKLVEKAQTVEENLGDAASLMGLYDAELEDDATATAIEDADDGFLDLDDFEFTDLDAMIADAQASLDEDEGPVPRAESSGLYADDVAFTKAAFDELVAPQAEATAAHDSAGHDASPASALVWTEEDLILPEWHTERPSCHLIAPEDLQGRCYQLPREALPKNWEFHLSADREHVEQAIRAARTKKGEWPKVHLLWELHPVMQWLTDKVLVRFGRHEAPVVVAPELTPRESVFVFHGVLSNKRSQPVIQEWFAVTFKNTKATGIVDLPAILDRTGFANGISNPGTGTSRAKSLTALIEPAVDQAREHLESSRLARGKELGAILRKDTKRLKKWHRSAQDHINHQAQLAKSRRGSLSRPQQERFARKHRIIDAWADKHTRWLKETLHAEQTPYLKLAVVFTGS